MAEIISAVRSNFDDRDQARLAFFSLFQRVIDAEILIFMGIPQFVSQDDPKLPWALIELIGMQQDHWNELARRAHELRLVAQTEDGLWLIENQVANGLRLLIPLTISTESQRVRAFVESTALSARQHFERVKKGDSSAERQIRMNEANYLSAVSVAASSKWPGCILDTLLGLQVIYREPNRLSEWRTLLKSVVPIFTDTRTGDALPGMEDMWLVMASFELGVFLRQSKWQEAYPLQAKVVERLEQAAKPWLTGLHDIGGEGLQTIRRLAGELSRLGEISEALGKHDTASQILFRSRHLTEANTAGAALARAEMLLKSARELKYEDERRRKLIKDGIDVAEGALKSVDPNNQEMFGRIHSVLGSLQSESELFDEAVRSYEEALFVRKAMGDLLGAGRAEGNIGGVLEATGHRRKALDTLQRAKALFEQAGDAGKQDLNYTRIAIGRIESELLRNNALDSPNYRKSAELNRVIHHMVANIRRGDSLEYFVGLVGYFIEGYPYSASGLGVDSYSTPDIHVTEDGFACTCAFPTKMVQPATMKTKRIIKSEVNGVPTDLVAVNVEVKFEDIYLIGGFWDGKQHDLFSDVETMASRQTRFMREMGLWFERRKAERNAEP
jgi:tetratricopeptide (TPR) repeat protein